MAARREKKLTDRQARFAQEYVVDFNGTAAFKRANPNYRGSAHTSEPTRQ